MFIDMHMHESTFSKDSFLKLDEMVELAKERGLGAICITDHDDMGLKEYAKEYSEKTGFPIFVGIEFFSLQGDIVALGIEEYPKERVDAQKFIDIVKEQGGICFSAHPFRNNNRGLEENLRIVKGLDGVEVLNGSTLPEANKKSGRLCKRTWTGHCWLKRLSYTGKDRLFCNLFSGGGAHDGRPDSCV